MPVFTEEELKTAIAEHRIGGVSLDTSIFDRYGCNLKSKALRGLDQFRGTRTNVLLSEIVIGEVKSHIVRAAEEAQVKLRAALNDMRKARMKEVDIATVEELLEIEQAPQEFADAAFAEFSGLITPTVVNADGRVTHAEVLQRYQRGQPPFSSTGAKKNEFPDALALLSLENWAQENNTLLLAVSSDGDWKNFAETSERLICVRDLATALNYFNEAGHLPAARAVAALRGNAVPGLRDEIEAAINRYFEDLLPDVQANSSFHYELEAVYSDLQGWEIEDGALPKVIRADEDEVVFSIAVSANIAFTGTFSYSIYDSVDRDYMDFGTDDKEVQQAVPLLLLISIARGEDPEPVLNDVDVVLPHLVVDFDDIDPDWRDPD